MLQTPKLQTYILNYLEKYRTLTLQTLRGNVTCGYQWVTTFKF